MNISFNTQNLYNRYHSGGRSLVFASSFNSGKHGSDGYTDMISQDVSQSTKEKSVACANERRELLSQLEQEKYQTEEMAFIGKKDDFSKLYGLDESVQEKDKDTKKQKLNYNPSQVANRIQTAKTPTSAANALLLARRKLVNLKGKAATGKVDTEEVQAAIIHATRMVIAAKRKKKNLEQESMCEIISKRDERIKEQEDIDRLKNADIYAEEEKLAEQEDRLFEERQEAVDRFVEELAEGMEEMSDATIAKMNEELAALGEDILEKLEEQMNVLSELEVLDPHMSEDQLEEVKRKHRSAEERAIMKANMDYIKTMTKHNSTSMLSALGISALSDSKTIFHNSPTVVSPSVSVSNPAPSIDVSL